MHRYDIERYAVIGAGNMGAGIVQKIATEGFDVVMVDLDEARVTRGLKIIHDTLDEGVARKLFTPERVDEILARIHGTADWQVLATVDLIVEAVFEDIQVKGKVFARLGEVCRPDTILATNTSSFYVRDVARAVSHPERVLGLHYFYHPAKNRLVEVIGHEGTAPEVLEAAWAAQEAIGKTPIASADAPGFVVNRFFVPWLNESVRIVEEGLANIATVEAAAKKAFHIGMGPFELMNVTGVPIALHASTNLGEQLGSLYQPSPLLAAQVERAEHWQLEGEPDAELYAPVADRLLGVVFQVAASLVEEGVASVEDTEIGARVGLRWTKGPFELANEVGLPQAAERAAVVAAPHQLDLPELLREPPEAGIEIRLVTSRDRGGMKGVWVQRPDALNALNEAVVAQLEKLVAAARGSDAAGLVIGGTGKAFVAGADVKFFVDALRRDDVDAIYEFTRRGQLLFGSLSHGDRPVVARVQGLSLGGGSELALACDWIVASPKATFGFPETGIGIYPGLGGTQRLSRRIGVPLAKYLIFTGQVVDADTALRLGICDMVVPFADLDAACSDLCRRGAAQERQIPEAPWDPGWQMLWDFFSKYRIIDILKREALTDGDPVLSRATKQIQRKSPYALYMAERLINRGAAMSLQEGLDLELAELRKIFGHPDALEGLSALIEGRRPTWKQL